MVAILNKVMISESTSTYRTLICKIYVTLIMDVMSNDRSLYIAFLEYKPQ